MKLKKTSSNLLMKIHDASKFLILLNLGAVLEIHKNTCIYMYDYHVYLNCESNDNFSLFSLTMITRKSVNKYTTITVLNIC